MVNRTAESGFNMKEVSADKAYLGAESLLIQIELKYLTLTAMAQSQNYGLSTS
ncbi:MAG TPA: hypothetical protein VJS64_16600 [Pyrinomonadaceae bacterium]|nr:hypothetical protein [Pyrinomonadaceae bacterium]